MDEVSILVENYRVTNSLLRNRTIILGALFIVILGLVHTVQENKRKRWAYESLITDLGYLAYNKCAHNELDSIFKITLERDDFGVFSLAQVEKLRNDMEKSNYQDQTPIYDLMIEYDKQMKGLGIKTGDYSFSMLGISTSLSDWIYFSPIILLLLYHDLASKILYRKTLREKLNTLNVDGLIFGSELFGAEKGLAETENIRFVRRLTNLFIAIFLSLPPFAAIIGMIFYGTEQSSPNYSSFIFLIQAACFVIMLIELKMIFYWENLLGFQSAMDWVKKHFPKRG